MPSFKPKNPKKIKCNENSLITLDIKHKEIMDKLNSELDKELSKLNNLNSKEEKEKIQRRINNLIKKKKEYLLTNSEDIFSYFEKKKEISNDNGNKTVLNYFFNQTTEKEKRNEQSESSSYFENINNKIDISNYSRSQNVCKYCSNEMIPVEHDGVMICSNSKCGNQEVYILDHEKPYYKEPPKEMCFYAYKKINHFREILAQCQAKETTVIPKEVITNLKKQITKERISLSDLTNLKCKEILKKLGYNKYYEHIPFIKDKLGIKPPIMSPMLEEKLCNLFMEIQKPYAKHCPNNRTNFLNYYYVLYKICELLNERKFLPYFPMLKDPVKRMEQDIIWKNICHELNWKFIPTYTII